MKTTRSGSLAVELAAAVMLAGSLAGLVLAPMGATTGVVVQQAQQQGMDQQADWFPHIASDGSGNVINAPPGCPVMHATLIGCPNVGMIGDTVQLIGDVPGANFDSVPVGSNRGSTHTTQARLTKTNGGWNFQFTTTQPGIGTYGGGAGDSGSMAFSIATQAGVFVWQVQ